jgi:hypothetical protein
MKAQPEGRPGLLVEVAKVEVDDEMRARAKAAALKPRKYSTKADLDTWIDDVLRAALNDPTPVNP